MNRRKKFVRYGILDVFCEAPFCGNPAGVVFDAASLSDEQMQKIAKEINVANTSFLFQPESDGDFKIRYFCPEKEINMCGHATIASVFAWGAKQVKGMPKAGGGIVRLETKIGTLSATIKRRNGSIQSVGVAMPKPEFYAADIDKAQVFDALNIDESATVASYPIEIVNSGLYFLEIGIKNKENLLDIDPDFRKIHRITEELNIDSIQVFTRDTFDKDSTVLSRTFFPKYGVNEDPVCGTGNAAIASYLIRNELGKKAQKRVHFVGEQGHSVSRPGKVYIDATCNNDEVEALSISGAAVLVFEGNIYLD